MVAAAESQVVPSVESQVVPATTDEAESQVVPAAVETAWPPMRAVNPMAVETIAAEILAATLKLAREAVEFFISFLFS